MTLPAKSTPSDAIEGALMQGDLSKLTPPQRIEHYLSVCKSLGLNPMTQPFAYITLNGKLVLYALRACADQLRKINGVSLEIVSRDVADDILTIHVRATLPDGRRDEELGSVPFPPALKGENRANAELKCVTKAKRRATLSICGLGWLDETEVEAIPGAKKEPKSEPDAMDGKPRPTSFSPEQASAPPTPTAGTAPSKLTIAQVMAVEKMAKEAADRGSEVFQRFWANRSAQERVVVKGLATILRAKMDEADKALEAGIDVDEGHDPETGEVRP